MYLKGSYWGSSYLPYSSIFLSHSHTGKEASWFPTVIDALLLSELPMAMPVIS